MTWEATPLVSLGEIDEKPTDGIWIASDPEKPDKRWVTQSGLVEGAD
jgi:hypothetical protein